MYQQGPEASGIPVVKKHVYLNHRTNNTESMRPKLQYVNFEICLLGK